MTNAEIEAFRLELLADPIARITDAPHLCRRATANVRGAAKIAARDVARRHVGAMHSSGCSPAEARREQ